MGFIKSKLNIGPVVAINLLAYIWAVLEGYKFEIYYNNTQLQADKETLRIPNHFQKSNTIASSLLPNTGKAATPQQSHSETRQNSSTTTLSLLSSKEERAAPQQLHSEVRQQRALDVMTEADTQVETIVENKKPTIILHVGPMKTGTTYLQRKVFSQIRRALKKDNILFKKSGFTFRQFGRLLEECLIFGDDCPDDSMLQQLERFYDSAYTPDPSLTFVHSVETYSSIPDNNFTISLFRKLQEKWNVKVMLYYRRPTEWFYSLYKQIRKGQMYLSGNSRFKDYTSPTTNFDDFMDSAVNGRHGFDKDSLHTAELFRKIFGNENVKILDYHVPNLAAEFFCNGLNATACCAKANELKIKFVNDNNNFLYDEDLLVMEAYSQGLLNSFSIPRHEATLKVHDYLVRERMNIPNRCVSQTQIDWIWNRTVYTEYNLAPNPSSNKTMLREKFENSATKKFCDIDATAVLKNVTWRNLLSSCDFLKPEFADNCTKTVQLSAQ